MLSTIDSSETLVRMKQALLPPGSLHLFGKAAPGIEDPAVGRVFGAVLDSEVPRSLQGRGGKCDRSRIAAGQRGTLIMEGQPDPAGLATRLTLAHRADACRLFVRQAQGRAIDPFPGGYRTPARFPHRFRRWACAVSTAVIVSLVLVRRTKAVVWNLMLPQD